MRSKRFLLTLSVVLLCGLYCFALEPWGLVKFAVAHVRSAAGHANEQVTQATMGTPMKLLSEQSGWIEVELPDGYKGWISRPSIQQLSQKEFDSWRESDRVVVTCGAGHSTSTELTDREGRNVSDLDRLDILQVVSAPKDGVIELKTPDGRTGYVPEKEVMGMDRFFDIYSERPLPVNSALILDNARDMLGRVYLWGGTSFKQTDCSGLTRICYLMNGILIPRDASPQSKVGDTVTLAEAQPGDLVFFANSKGRVDHVALYLGDGKIIHSSGSVKINSLDPAAPDYVGRKYHLIKHIEDSSVPGVQKIAEHPWYFLR